MGQTNLNQSNDFNTISLYNIAIIEREWCPSDRSICDDPHTIHGITATMMQHKLHNPPSEAEPEWQSHSTKFCTKFCTKSWKSSEASTDERRTNAHSVMLQHLATTTEGPAHDEAIMRLLATATQKNANNYTLRTRPARPLAPKRGQAGH
jgi:hypothetical protein